MGELTDETRKRLLRISQAVRRDAAALPVTTAQGAVLSLLRAGPMGVGELARAEGVQPPTMTQVINRMEAAGWVTRSGPARKGARYRSPTSGEGSPLMCATAATGCWTSAWPSSPLRTVRRFSLRYRSSTRCSALRSPTRDLGKVESAGTHPSGGSRPNCRSRGRVRQKRVVAGEAYRAARRGCQSDGCRAGLPDAVARIALMWRSICAANRASPSGVTASTGRVVRQQCERIVPMTPRALLHGNFDQAHYAAPERHRRLSRLVWCSPGCKRRISPDTQATEEGGSPHSSRSPTMTAPAPHSGGFPPARSWPPS